MTDLLAAHDVLLVDLDGTLYTGRAAVPHAVDAVRAAARRGVRTVYVTNNAARAPGDVAAHLAELGFPAAPDDVATSAQAGAAMLGAHLPPGAPVLVVGTAALAAEVLAVGLRTTDRAAEAVAVVQGHSPDTGWRLLAEACVALRAGAVWVACNTDATLPSERGPLPGNGSMVAALRTATGREPRVAGKPAPTVLGEAARRAGARAPLVVGDRLDTDVEGGRAAGLPTLLVLTGVSGAADVLTAPAARRPDFLAADLRSLTAPPDELRPGPRPGWTVTAGADGWELAGDGEPVDGLRALCAAHWSRGGGPTSVTGAGARARAALAALGLDATASATVAATATADGREAGA